MWSLGASAFPNELQSCRVSRESNESIMGRKQGNEMGEGRHEVMVSSAPERHDAPEEGVQNLLDESAIGDQGHSGFVDAEGEVAGVACQASLHCLVLGPR